MGTNKDGTNKTEKWNVTVGYIYPACNYYLIYQHLYEEKQSRTHLYVGTYNTLLNELKIKQKLSVCQPSQSHDKDSYIFTIVFNFCLYNHILYVYFLD